MAYTDEFINVIANTIDLVFVLRIAMQYDRYFMNCLSVPIFPEWNCIANLKIEMEN